MATTLCPDYRSQLGMVRPGASKKPEAGISRTGIIKEVYSLPKERIRTTALEIIREAAGEVVDLGGVEIIALGGRGLGGPGGSKLIRALVNVLGATVGVPRAAVDAGWISHLHQVGQTSKTVVPKIYITCGISGAIQRTAGVSGVDCTIAINKDPEAPIFGIADYGITGNLFGVVPVITEEIKKARV